LAQGRFDATWLQAQQRFSAVALNSAPPAAARPPTRRSTTPLRTSSPTRAPWHARRHWRGPAAFRAKLPRPPRFRHSQSVAH